MVWSLCITITVVLEIAKFYESKRTHFQKSVSLITENATNFKKNDMNEKTLKIHAYILNLNYLFCLYRFTFSIH